MTVKITAPENPIGFTLSELQAFMYPPELADFLIWARGCTHGIDEQGKALYYPGDVEKFLWYSRRFIWDKDYVF